MSSRLAPPATSSPSSPTSSTRPGSRRSSRRRGWRLPPSGPHCSALRSRSGGARRSQTWRARSSRRGRSGGWRSYGSTRMEERIAADIELGLHREVTGELESARRGEPAAGEGLRAPHARAVPKRPPGRGAAGVSRYAQRVRRAARDRAGRRASGAARADPASGGGARRDRRRPGGRRRGERDPPGDARAGASFRSSGSLRGAELARRLAETFDVPGDVTGALGRVTQYVAAMQGLGPLHDELHALCGDVGGTGRSSTACSRDFRRSCASAAPRTS